MTCPHAHSTRVPTPASVTISGAPASEVSRRSHQLTPLVTKDRFVGNEHEGVRLLGVIGAHRRDGESSKIIAGERPFYYVTLALHHFEEEKP